MPARKAIVEEYDLPNAIAWEDLRTSFWSQQPHGSDLAKDAKSRATGHRLRLESLTK
jgi:hypothetical protein